MFTDQIGKLKEVQFSEPFQKWFYTLLFLPLAVYFRFIIGTSLILDKDYTAYSRTAWILGGVIFVWFVWKWLSADEITITGLEKYLAVFFVIACLSTIFSSNTSLSQERLIDILNYIFGVYILLDLRKSPALWQGMINALLITAGISSLLILISAVPWIKLYQLTLPQILSHPTYLLKVIPRLPYSLGLHQSVTAGYLVMIIPLAAFQLIRSKPIFWKALHSIGLALNFIILLLTQSRGGLLGFACLILVLIVIYRKEIWSYILENKAVSFVALSSLFLAGTVLIFFIGKSRGFDVGGRTIQMRFDQWRIAMQIIQEYPWLGSGLGTFGQKYLELRDPAFYPGTFIHAHNQLIQITTELGILGLCALLLLIWHGIRLLRSEQGAKDISSKVSLIALGGLFGVLVPDAILTSSMIVFLLLFYLVWILPTEKNLPSLEKNRGLALLSIAAVVLASCTGWILWKLFPYDIALQAASQDNWQKARYALLITQERDPGNPYYSAALGYVEGQTACQSGEYLNEALEHYQESFHTYQNWGISHANAAVLYSIIGEYQNAADQMEMAIQNYPNNSLYSCLLGDYYLHLNKYDQAVASYGNCVEQRPDYLDSPYWQEDKNRLELLPSVFARAESNLTSRKNKESEKLLAGLYLAAGDLDNAERIIRNYLDQYPNDLDGNLTSIKILDSRGDLPAANQRIGQLLLSDPRNPDLWIFKGKIAQLEGNEKDAEAALTLGYSLQPSAEKSWTLGQFYQSQGELQQAQDLYWKALNSFPSPLLEFSQRTAGRWPIQGEYLNCMPVIRTYHEYFNPALSSALGLEDQDCNLAGCIYQKLLNLNPSIKEAQIRMDHLQCPNIYDGNPCFNQ